MSVESTSKGKGGGKARIWCHCNRPLGGAGKTTARFKGSCCLSPQEITEEEASSILGEKERLSLIQYMPYNQQYKHPIHRRPHKHNCSSGCGQVGWCWHRQSCQEYLEYVITSEITPDLSLQQQLEKLHRQKYRHTQYIRRRGNRVVHAYRYKATGQSHSYQEWPKS